MFKTIDVWFVTIYLLLAIVSLVIMASVAPNFFWIQLGWLTLGLLVFFYLANQDSSLYLGLSKLAYPFSIVILILTLLLGSQVRGSTRWIQLGSFHLQTSEMVKPLFILAFSHFILKFRSLTLSNLFKLIILLAIPLVLILRQPDLGTALVILVLVITQLFIAKAPTWFFGLGIIVVLVFVYLAPHLLHDYQLQRLESFLNPTADPLGSGYNLIQSLIAIGSGGIFGKGLGHGTQSHLRFLPEHHTDFIFASLVEELGLIGGLVVLLLLTLLIGRLIYFTLHSKSLFSKLVLSGTSGYLFFQSAVNIGMNLGVAPVTGVTLPLVSYGGSSILAIAITLGLANSFIQNSQTHDPIIEIK